MCEVVPIEHDGIRGLVAVGIIVEAIGQRVRDQLLVLIIAAVIALLLAFAANLLVN
jgi:sensor histidine kinase regulating citrate/malate metabolism